MKIFISSKMSFIISVFSWKEYFFDRIAPLKLEKKPSRGIVSKYMQRNNNVHSSVIIDIITTDAPNEGKLFCFLTNILIFLSIRIYFSLCVFHFHGIDFPSGIMTDIILTFRFKNGNKNLNRLI